jgi:hypothetical protein
VKARWRNRLTAFQTTPVFAVPQTIESLRQLVRALDQHATDCEAHLPIFGGADHIPFILQQGIVIDGARELLDDEGTAELADSLHRVIQLQCQPLSHLFHDLSLLG